MGTTKLSFRFCKTLYIAIFWFACSTTSQAQSLIGSEIISNFEAKLSADVALNIGSGDCKTALINIKTAEHGVLLTINKPKLCSFKNLELINGSDVLPLTGLSQEFELKNTLYKWRDEVDHGSLFFSKNKNQLITNLANLKIREPQCTTLSCLTSNDDRISQSVTSYLKSVQDAMTQSGNSMVFEKRSGQRVSDGSTFSGPDGIIWRRCAIGRDWDSQNRTCKGEPVKAAWLNMVELASKDTFGGFNDWRLPTEAEFSSLVGKQQKCDHLKERLSELFPGVWSGVYFGSHHWLLDNSTSMTNPLSTNLEPSSRYCTMTNDDLRPHAPQPAILVRGGTVPSAWQIALSKTPYSQTVSAQSKKDGVAMLEGYNSKLERVAEAFSSPSNATTSNISRVEWTILSEENGGGLAHWYTKKYNAKCTSGRKSGERITIHLLKSSGKYQEVSGSVKNSLAEAARDACS